MFNLTNANRKWWTLLAMSGALALVFIDQTALAVALPAIQSSLKLDNSLLQWVINAYLLSLSVLILLGGKIGDSLGHKRAFLFGVVVFIIASILCALAQSGPWIITTRVLEGVGGAFMIPSTNAIVANAFPEGERGRAIGIYFALGALFLAFGPLLGGALTEWLGWRSVFWVNVPIAVASIILANHVVPRWRPTEKLMVDYMGLLLSIVFISCFVLALMEGPHWGWGSNIILLLFASSVLSLIAFIFWERRSAHPLVELEVFKNPIFSIVTAVMVLVQAVNIAFVFWAIFLQTVMHYSPLSAGLLLLPTMLPFIVMAPLGGHLRDKIGPAIPMRCGSLLLLFSFIWLGLFSHYQSYAWLFPGFLIFGIGIPCTLSGSTATVMNVVHAQQRGIAGAILNCARQFGGSIGLAVLGSFLSSLNTWKLTNFLQHTAPPALAKIQETSVENLLGNSPVASQAIGPLPAHSIALLKSAAVHSYTFAFSMTMFLAAAFSFASLLLVLKVPLGKKTSELSHV